LSYTVKCRRGLSCIALVLYNISGMKADKQQIYNSIMESLPVGFSMVDREGRIVDFNPAAEKLTGYLKKEVLGKSHLEVLHGTSDVNVCPLFKRTLRQRKKSVSTETTMMRKDGERITTAVTSFPLYEGGKFIGGVELFRDISEQKRRERERKNFLSMFVHDMKNPVMTSKGFLDRMASKRAGPLTKKQLEYVEIIHDGLDRLETLVKDFLEFSRLEAKAYRPSLKKLDLREAIRKNIRALKVESEEKGVRIVARCKGSIPGVRADETMINRVLSNLLSNAVQYTVAGSTIAVRCSETDGSVLVEVVNPGPGIPEEQLPYIFDAFHRVSRDAKGSGLGLAISKKIIELHNGRIRAGTTPEGETVLSFILPIVMKG
jgi:PAS domain S-box-containing protein